MTQPGSSAADDSRTPPLAQELDAVQVRYTWKFGDGAAAPSPDEARAEAEPDPEPAAAEEDPTAALHTQIRLYTAALEDIVTLALSNADYKERAIMMHRRAVAALSGYAKK